MSTSHVIITTYTVVHYPVFGAHSTHKKSSDLVTGGLFDLHGDLATFMFTPSSFLLKDTIFVSIEGVAKGISFHFKLIGGFPLVKMVVVVCLVIFANLSLPE